MEFYSKRQPDHIQLIKGIFTIIALAAVITLILIFTLSVNRKASASDGEIISVNTPIKYYAPTDAQLSEILVKEGDHVMAGDKILSLKNENLVEDLAKSKRRLEGSQRNIQIFNQQLINLETKIAQHESQLGILDNKYKNQKQGQSYEISNLDEQLLNDEEKISISQQRIDKLEQLYKDGGISGKEYEKLYKSYLDEKNRLINLRNDAFQEKNKSERIDIDIAETLNKLRLDMIRAESDQLDMEKQLEEEKLRSAELAAKITNVQAQINGLIMRAAVDGYVTDIFTTNENTLLVTKQKLLFVLNPSNEEKFFAKLKLKEEELKDIAPGQTVHMKLAVYNHFEFGVLKGKVVHINKEILEKKVSENKVDSNGGFYAIVEIPEEEAQRMNIKSGYQVNGDIILQKVKLYRFIFESMFT
jgi:membrane fusion protein